MKVFKLKGRVTYHSCGCQLRLNECTTGYKYYSPFTRNQCMLGDQGCDTLQNVQRIEGQLRDHDSVRDVL